MSANNSNDRIAYGTLSERSPDLDIRLDVTYDVRPGRIRLETKVSGKLGANLRNLAGRNDTIDIVYGTKNGEELREDARSLLSSLSGSVSNIPGAVIPSSPQFLPDDLLGYRSDSAQLWAGIFGNRLTGQTPVTVTKEIEFNEVTIPEPPNREIDLGGLPTPVITVQVKPKEFLQRSFSDPLQVEFEIPIEAFVQVRDLSFQPCSETFSAIDAQIDRLRGRVDDFIQDKERLADRVQEARNNFEEATNYSSRTTRTVQRTSQTGGRKTTGGGNYSSGSDDDDSGGSRGTVGGAGVGWATMVDGGQVIDSGLVNDLKNKKNQLTTRKNRAYELENKVSSIPSNRSDCKETFQDRIDDILERIQEAVSDIGSLVEDLGGLVDRPCEDQYGSLYENVEDFRDKVQNIRNADLRDIANLRSTSQQLENNVERQLDQGQECFDELKSMIESARSNLMSQTGLDPCLVKHPEVGERIQKMKEDLEGVDEVDLETAREFRQEYRSLRDLVEDARDRDSDCSYDLDINADRIGTKVRNLEIPNECKQKYPDLWEQKENILADGVRLERIGIGGFREQFTRQDVLNLMDRGANLNGNIKRTIPGDDDKCSQEFHEIQKEIAQTVVPLNDRIRELVQNALDCTNVDENIISAVDNMEAAVQNAIERNPTQTNKRRARTAVEGADRLISRIENNVQEQNPCRDKLKSRIRSMRNQVSSYENQEPERIPCADQYPSLEDRVDGFREDVLSVSPPVGTNQVRALLNSGSSILVAVSDQTEQSTECREKYLQQTRGALERLNRITADDLRTRTESQVKSKRAEQQQQLRDTIDEIDNVTGRSGGTLADLRNRLDALN